jgi:hypothetical protein
MQRRGCVARGMSNTAKAGESLVLVTSQGVGGAVDYSLWLGSVSPTGGQSIRRANSATPRSTRPLCSIWL